MWRGLFALLFVFVLTSCVHETPSAIVNLAEAHGSGNLQGVDFPSMRRWIRHHPATGRALLSACQSLPTPDAAWNETTEGRLCRATSVEHFYGLNGDDE